MKPINVTLNGEEAVFFWKDGKVCCEGYDLESEKSVLALTTFGEGIGALLVAMNDCCKSEAAFGSEVKKFVAGQKEIPTDRYDKWPEGQLLFEYYSYSSDPNKRWRGMLSAHLSERHYKRLLKDPDIGVKVRMARHKQLPEQYFHQLMNLSDLWVNYNLARNEKCPIDVLEILSQNKNPTVRRAAQKNIPMKKGLEI